MSASADFARLLTVFFTQYLMQQRQVSPHTIASYRDTFRLLVAYVHKSLGKPPQELSVADIDPDLIGAFLSHLENGRGNHPRTRNIRLAAIRSFFRIVALHAPEHAALAQRVLAIPSKRWTRRIVDFLSDDEIEALLQAPDQGHWVGRRDHTLLLLAVQTGMRASEIIGLRCADIHCGDGAHLRCHGKGRKERCIPLRRDSVAALDAWLMECGDEPDAPVFRNQRGRPLRHESLEYLLARNVEIARTACPSLRKKRISPHTLRHTAAMTLLRNGVDRATIALWLGHESVQTTYIYLHADLELKEQAMARTTPSGTTMRKYQPEDAVLSFLSSL